MRRVWTVLSTPEVRVVAAHAPAGRRAPVDRTPGDRAADRGAAHALLIEAVAAATGHDAGRLAVTHHCPRCGTTDHGVPALTLAGTTLDLRVSLSRAPGLVLAAFGTAPGLGVDVERAGAAADPALDRLIPPWAGSGAGAPEHRTPEQRTPELRTRAWARIEAALKAWGTGLHVPADQVRDLGGHAAIGTDPRPAALTDLDVPGYQAALAVLAAPAPNS